jgi:hypothetical protein
VQVSLRFVAQACLLGVLAALATGCVPEGRSGKRVASGAPRPGVDAGASAPADAGGTPSSADAAVRDAGEAPAPDAGVPLDAGAPADGGDLCLEQPVKVPQPATAYVYYGTARPTYVPLTDEQILAIGTFDSCSGVLIDYTWVLTAEHCGLRAGVRFCIGPQAANPNICFRSARVIDNPSGDMTLVELERDARELAPTVQPVAILSEDMDSTWLNRTAEAAGYGQQENGGYGEREFTAEPIVSLRGDTLTIDGQGRRGVCFGDSGGPVFVIASDGSVRVAGDLSNGDGNCVGRDNYTRVDVHRAWIESYVGTTQPPGPQPCGAVDAVGSCNADRTQATWCAPDATLQVATCGGTQVCAWDTGAAGYRCLEAAQDPCRGITERGACRDNVLTWCQQGRLLARDCGVCAESCVPESRDESPSYNCIPSACGDLDFRGRCEGDVAVWCTRDGQLERRDCAASGQTCGLVDQESGYYCQ